MGRKCIVLIVCVVMGLVLIQPIDAHGRCLPRGFKDRVNVCFGHNWNDADERHMVCPNNTEEGSVLDFFCIFIPLNGINISLIFITQSEPIRDCSIQRAESIAGSKRAMNQRGDTSNGFRRVRSSR